MCRPGTRQVLPMENRQHTRGHDHHRPPDGKSLRLLGSATGYALRQSQQPDSHLDCRALSPCLSRDRHGLYKGDRVVEREDIRFADLDPMAIDNLHVQFPSKVTFQQAGRPSASGIGVFEQLILGPYKPLGFTGMLDPAG